MENKSILPMKQDNAEDMLAIIELEDRLELATAAEEGRCDRCNDNKYPDTIAL